MTRYTSLPPTLSVVALALACGHKNSPDAAAPDSSAAKSEAPAPESSAQLVDAWYVDRDDDGVPDFVELEQNFDPNLDECIVEACGKEAGDGRLVSEINTLIILDVSGSMAGKVAGKRTSKLDLARKAVTRYVETMPDVEVMKVGLIAFGHEGNPTPAAKEKSCEAVDVLRAMGPVDAKAITAAMEKLAPAGWSPIAGALAASAKAVPEEVRAVNRVILVTDGFEACDGDPIEVARQMKETNHLTFVDVIGFGVGAKEDESVLQQIAGVTDGTYQLASTVAEFDHAFDTLNFELWESLDSWMCAVGSAPLMACYEKRSAEAIERTEKEIEAMAKRESGGGNYTADLQKIKARTELTRDSRNRVVTTYKVKLDEIRKASEKRRPKTKAKAGD
jgi:hypothetical protein